MKKLIPIIIVSLVLSGAGMAQTWHTANQKMIAWDAVTKNSDGTMPIPADEISYEVYIYDAIDDPQHENPFKLGTTSDTKFLVTLTKAGRYFVGVAAVWTIDGERRGESEITWSSEPEYNFGLQYGTPAKPTGLRIPPSDGPMPLSIKKTKK